MGFNVGGFLQRYAPYIGAGIGSLIPIPGVGTAVGGAIGGILGGAVSANTGNFETDPAKLNPANGTGIQDMIRRQEGRNIDKEAASATRNSGVGFDMGQFTQAAAIRGAGRNAFGTIMLESRERAARERGQFTLNQRDSISRGRDSMLQQLMQSLIGANAQANTLAFQSSVNANDRRDSYLDAALGTAAQFGLDYLKGPQTPTPTTVTTNKPAEVAPKSDDEGGYFR